MSFALAVVVVALVGLGVAGVVIAGARTRLPEHAWWRAAGAMFAADFSARSAAYADAAEQQGVLHERAVAAREDLEPFLDGAAEPMARDAIAALEELPRELASVLEGRERGLEKLTIVLFGCTKAGKSSLFAALTGEGFDGVGDGRQNVTRDNRRATLGHVEVVDSPGISGVGSKPLEATTLDAVHEADVLLVHVTDDRLSKEDLARIDALAWPSRPVIVAVNVKAADLRRIVERPDKVFRERDLGSQGAGRLLPRVECRSGKAISMARRPPSVVGRLAD